MDGVDGVPAALLSGVDRRIRVVRIFLFLRLDRTAGDDKITVMGDGEFEILIICNCQLLTYQLKFFICVIVVVNIKIFSANIALEGVVHFDTNFCRAG